MAAVGITQFAGKHTSRNLSVNEARNLYGGDEYDDYALCDGHSNCVACDPDRCAYSSELDQCTLFSSGSDGCQNNTSEDTYCKSNTIWSDCEYLGGVQVCGGPYIRNDCQYTDVINNCSWTQGIPGCIAGAHSSESCQNCATIPKQQLEKRNV
jgi:hypothetical protein